jgi:hypothetical protein
MQNRLALAATATVFAALSLIPVVGANAQLAPDPGGVGALTQVLPGDPDGSQAFTPAKKAKKAAKLVYRGRH